jgi:hypothetical protein
MMAENPEAFRFDDIAAAREIDPEAEVPAQRMIGGYLPVPGKPGFFTRELMLRQEMELADRAEELQTAAGQGAKAMQKAMLPVCCLILFRRNDDGDVAQATENDLLDNFKSRELLALIRDVTGMGAQEEDREGTSPTPALPTTETSSAA